MLSFQENNNKIAIVTGPDFKKTTGIYLYSQYEKGNHIDQTNEIIQKLEYGYDGDINIKEDNKVLTIQNRTLEFDNQINMYGLNKFQLAPDKIPNEIKAIAIYGKSGSGKSYFTAQYIENYLKLHNYVCRVIFFSQKDITDDHNFDRLRKHLQVIDMDEQMQNPFTIEDVKQANAEQLKPSLFVFDDTLSMSKYALSSILYSMQSILKLGRQYLCDIVVTNQQSNEANKTKLINDNINHTVYMTKNNKANINKLLVSKHGFSQKEADYLTSIKTRFICLNDGYIICDSTIFTIDPFRDYIKSVTNKPNGKSKRFKSNDDE